MDRSIVNKERCLTVDGVICDGVSPLIEEVRLKIMGKGYIRL
jgi:hypothetical protein